VSGKKGSRGLSRDDLEIWRRVTDTVVPLSKSSEAAIGPAPKSKPILPDVQPIRRTETAIPKISVDLAPGTVDRLRAATPQMDRRNYDRLTRGKLRPERRIDLHGMTAAAAHGALRQFLIGAQAQGVRVVLVVTGKGRTEDDNMTGQRRGVIRHALPHWLDQEPVRSLIVQAVPAAKKDGGSGAFYVYLRRNRGGVHA